jgi:F-type H+-transporting ATPase subunit epsilon
MKLQFVSLKGVQFEGEIISLNIKTTAGEITVLDNHLPLITSLNAGKANIIKIGGDKLSLDIASGFLEVGPNNQVVILAD